MSQDNSLTDKDYLEDLRIQLKAAIEHVRAMPSADAKIIFALENADNVIAQSLED